MGQHQPRPVSRQPGPLSTQQLIGNVDDLFYLANTLDAAIADAKAEIAALAARPTAVASSTSTFDLGIGVAGYTGFLRNTAGNLSWDTSVITGGGTLNYVPKFTAATTIGNSVITDDGSVVGVTVDGGLKVGADADVSIYQSAKNSFIDVGTPTTGNRLYIRLNTGSSFRDRIVLDNTTAYVGLIGTVSMTDVWGDVHITIQPNTSTTVGSEGTVIGNHLYSYSDPLHIRIGQNASSSSRFYISGIGPDSVGDLRRYLKVFSPTTTSAARPYVALIPDIGSTYISCVTVGGTTPPSASAILLHVSGDINAGSGYGFRINEGATLGSYLRGNGTRFVESTGLVCDTDSVVCYDGDVVTCDEDVLIY